MTNSQSSCFSLTLMLSLSGLFPAATLWAQVAQSELDRTYYAAPEKCIAFIAWSSKSEPTLAGNSTQALMADPDVKEFTAQAKKFIEQFPVALFRSNPIPSPEAKQKQDLVRKVAPIIQSAFLERSGCLFVEKFEVPRDNLGQPILTGAMILNMGSNASEVAAQIAELLVPPQQAAAKIELAGTSASQITIGDFPESIFIGNLEDIVILAVGQSAYESAVQRLQAKQPPAWLASLQQHGSKLPHTHSMGYLNVKSINRSLRRAFGPNANVIFELLGTASINKVEMIAGLNQKNSSIHLLVDTQSPEGLLGAFTHTAIDESMLQKLPSDTIAAMALSTEFDKLLDVIAVVEQLAGGRSDYGKFKEAFLRETGFDIEADLMRQLDDSWMWYNAASDGWLTGTTLVAKVKDAEKLKADVDAMLTKSAEFARKFDASDTPSFFKQAYSGHDIFSVLINGFFAEPAGCVANDRLYLSLFPEAIKTAVKDLPADEVLFDQSSISEMRKSNFLKGEIKLIGLSYVDYRLQTQLTYPLFQIFKAGAASVFEDPDLAAVPSMVNSINLPPARSVIRHLDPTIVLARSSENGIEFEVRQTSPSNTAALAVPVSAGMILPLLPAVAQVRQAAREVQSQNNLRQLALASLNYESVYREFPGNSPGDKNQEHKFSWRVHILPFIEANGLYEQIRFDEPWDSPHNKKLIPQMPAFFRSPRSRAEPGMTVYRGFGTGGGMFEMEQRIGLGSITDGTSNTILVVEAPDELATPWTKPSSLNIDETTLKLLLSKSDSFLTVFADGSTHKVPTSIGVDELKHFAQRNDGHVVNFNFDSRRQSNRRRRKIVKPDPSFAIPSQKKKY